MPEEKLLEIPGDGEHAARLEAERCTLELETKSTRRLDTGKLPIEESPLFGGAAQQQLFET